MADLAESLRTFVTYVQTHLTGDEKGESADFLAFLLQLNQSCAAQEAAGEKITPPGLPLTVEEHEKFITSDCITGKL